MTAVLKELVYTPFIESRLEACSPVLLKRWVVANQNIERDKLILDQSAEGSRAYCQFLGHAYEITLDWNPIKPELPATFHACSITLAEDEDMDFEPYFLGASPGGFTTLQKALEECERHARAEAASMLDEILQATGLDCLVAALKEAK